MRRRPKPRVEMAWQRRQGQIGALAVGDVRVLHSLADAWTQEATVVLNLSGVLDENGARAVAFVAGTQCRCARQLRAAADAIGAASPVVVPKLPSEPLIREFRRQLVAQMRAFLR